MILKHFQGCFPYCCTLSEFDHQIGNIDPFVNEAYISKTNRYFALYSSSFVLLKTAASRPDSDPLSIPSAAFNASASGENLNAEAFPVFTYKGQSVPGSKPTLLLPFYSTFRSISHYFMRKRCPRSIYI